jgi:hypothetical protein
MPNTDTIRDCVIVDYGPVRDAVLILAESTTLAHHVNVSADDGYTVQVEQWGDIPYDLWGSGTQALWRLLCSIAYVGETVSLYEVVSHLDANNTRSVGAALSALCGVTS